MNSRNNQKSYKSEINVVNMGFVNSYIIAGERSIILVDTGLPGNAEKIIRRIKDLGYNQEQVSLIILTHAHFDHYGSIKELKDITDAKIAIHKNDSSYLIEGRSAPANPISGFSRFMMKMLKNRSRIIDGIKPDILIDEEMDLNTFGVKGKVIYTPGHTNGSVSILLDSKKCLTGDMLGSSLGRPTYGMFCNDIDLLKKSIVKIKSSNAKEIYLSHDGTMSIDKIIKVL